MRRSPRQLALSVVATLVFATASYRVVRSRTSAPGRAWIDRPGIPVELAGDGVHFASRGQRAPGLLHAIDHRCAERVPSWRLAPGDRLTFSADCRVRRTRMAAAARITLGLRLDVDREDASGFAALPDVGPRLAEAIVADRATRGPFGSVDALLRVDGIGPRTLDRIRPYLQSDRVKTSRRSAVKYTGSSAIRDSGAW